MSLNKLYDHDCDLCSLHENVEHVCFTGIGNTDNPKILVVGDAPSIDEDKMKIRQPYADDRARLLLRAFSDVGFRTGNDGDVYCTYAAKCCPYGSLKVKDARTCADRFLHKEILELKPKLIITLGKNAQVAVLGLAAPLSKTHGKVFDYEKEGFECRVIPIDNPFTVLSSPAKYKSWISDLNRARAVYTGASDPFFSSNKLKNVDFRLHASKSELTRVVDDILNNYRGHYLAVDVEASGLDDSIFDEGFNLFSVQFGVVSTLDKAQNTTLPVYIVPYETQHINADEDWKKHVRKSLTRLFEPGVMKIIAHNAKYDQKVLWRKNIPLFTDRCTMVLWADLHGEAPMSLKEIAYQITDLGGYEEEMESYFKEHGTYDAPLGLLCEYGCLDIVVTRHLMYVLEHEIMQMDERES